MVTNLSGSSPCLTAHSLKRASLSARVGSEEGDASGLVMDFSFLDSGSSSTGKSEDGSTSSLLDSTISGDSTYSDDEATENSG